MFELTPKLLYDELEITKGMRLSYSEEILRCAARHERNTSPVARAERDGEILTQSLDATSNAS